MINTKLKNKLHKRFNKIIEEYTNKFLEQFNLDSENCWWVGNRIGLDLFCFNDIYTIDLSDMIYCIEENVSYDEFIEHEDYCTKCNEYNFPIMNLQSWHKDAPRISKDFFNALNKCKYRILVDNISCCLVTGECAFCPKNKYTCFNWKHRNDPY